LIERENRYIVSIVSDVGPVVKWAWNFRICTYGEGAVYVTKKKLATEAIATEIDW